MSDLVPIRYVLEVGGQRHLVAHVSGAEAMSAVFRLQLRFFVGDEGAMDPDDLVRRDAVLRLQRDGVTEREIRALVTEVTLEARASGAPEVTAALEPRLALARHRRDTRVFRDRNVPTIVTEVLAAIGVSPTTRLQKTYADRPYCVQHRETDLDFVSRLLEDEGIFYFFLADGTLVLGDHASAYEATPGDTQLPFKTASGTGAARDAVHRIGRFAEMTAGTVTMRDWSPEHPSLDLDVSAPVAHAGSTVERYVYPGMYRQPADGTHKARVMASSIASASSALSGRSSCARHAPGHFFSLVDAPGDADTECVILSLDHDWSEVEEGSPAGRFELGFLAVSAKSAWTPPQVTPAPRLANPLTAVVTGPAGADIHTDARGWIKIHFPWDRRQPRDDRASDWVPVAQDQTGHSAAVPRTGWEVLAHFRDGDPDRPVVLGRMYNGADPFPERLPAHKTRSAFKSLSSPGRNGTNMIRFDDAAGAEEVFIHAEKDQRVIVGHDRREEILSDESVRIQNDETVDVTNQSRGKIGIDRVENVGQNQSLVVGTSRTRTVGGGDTISVTGNRLTTIGVAHRRRIGTDDATMAPRINESIGAATMEVYVDSHAMQSGRLMRLTVGGAVVEVAREERFSSTRLLRTEAVGGASIAKAGEDFRVTTSGSRTTRVGGAFKAIAGDSATLQGGTKFSLTTGEATLVADGITLKVGKTAIVLKGSITLQAADVVKVAATGANTLGAGKSSQN